MSSPHRSFLCLPSSPYVVISRCRCGCLHSSRRLPSSCMCFICPSIVCRFLIVRHSRSSYSFLAIIVVFMVAVAAVFLRCSCPPRLCFSFVFSVTRRFAVCFAVFFCCRRRPRRCRRIRRHRRCGNYFIRSRVGSPQDNPRSMQCVVGC